MAGDRLLRILAELGAEGKGWSAARLCAVCPQIVGVTGAGVMLMSGDVPRGSLCATNEVSQLIEELQFTLGEGPCMDAYHNDRPVGEPNLAAPNVPRWLAFSPPAVEAGVRAVFGFPVRIGAVRIGALNLYRDQPGALDDEQHADALVMAAVVARAVLAMQSEAPPGALAGALEAGLNLRFVVHQASGMVAVQLGVGLGEALVRLRGYAFAHDRLLTDVAHEVVSRRLSLA